MIQDTIITVAPNTKVMREFGTVNKDFRYN